MSTHKIYESYNYFMEITANRIKELRIYNELTQQELADLVGVSHHLISKWELDQREPRNEEMKKLCIVLNVSADYLLGITDIF